MSWLDWLERRFGAWSFPQLPLFIAAANGTIYILSLTQPAFPERMLLIPQAVVHGEVWRLVTFLFVPPAYGPIGMVFWLLLIYYYARGLETEWGEFRFSLFYFMGAFATIAAAFFIVHSSISNAPLNISMFLAFATLFPENRLYIYFIIPMKVRWIGWLIWTYTLWTFITGAFDQRVAIAASLVNYFIFFGPTLVENATQRAAVLRNRRRFKSPPND